MGMKPTDLLYLKTGEREQRPVGGFVLVEHRCAAA
jgi:hypothetical protein